MERNKEFVELVKLMRTYDKNLKTKRNKRFIVNFMDVNNKKCIPLTDEELYIYRSLVGVLPEKNKKELAKELCISEDTISKYIRSIKNILKLYFYDVLGSEPRYNKTINDRNKDVTIFDLGLSRTTLYSLRLLKCYYLKDISTMREETLKEIINYKDYLKIKNVMIFYGIKFDAKVYKIK